jgi:repressor LexA
MKLDLSEVELRALREIRNGIAHRGRAPSVRELMTALGYRWPRSAAVVIDKLVKRGYLTRGQRGSLRLLKDIPDDAGQARTVGVPLVGTASCGSLLLAEENVEATIPVSVRLARPHHRYFLLRASGDSMDLAGIRNGDLVLVRQQSSARTGDIVVATVDGEAAIKEFHPSSDVVVLRPRSSNPKHRDIILTRDFLVQGVVVTAIPMKDG